LRAEPKYSSRILLSSELKLALSPAETYETLVYAQPTSTWWMVLVRAAFFMLLFGATVAMTATGHITLALLFHIGLSWSFLVVWQALAGAAIILPARGRRVSLARAFELLFLAYVPWALYGLAMTALAVLAEPDMSALVVAMTGVAPIAWTSIVVAGFCRTVLGATAAGARQLTLVHQLVIWGGTMAFLWFAVGGWTPILQTVGL
jgi:hypothetical protein